MSNENPETIDFLAALHSRSSSQPIVPLSTESEDRRRTLELILRTNRAPGASDSSEGSDILDELDIEESPVCSPWVSFSIFF
jgi:hypothetical protein